MSVEDKKYTLDEALKLTGFEICEFNGDECDSCDKEVDDIYYRRTSYEYEEGEYFCADCVRHEPESWEGINKQIAIDHGLFNDLFKDLNK